MNSIYIKRYETYLFTTKLRDLRQQAKPMQEGLVNHKVELITR